MTPPHKHVISFIVAAATAGVLLFGGCQAPLKEPLGPEIELLKGKPDIAAAVAAINAHRQFVKPIRAGGNCLIEWYDDDGKKHKENPGIQLRLVPPDHLYFSGDILGGEAIRFGTNAEEFWFRIKPKEVSSYWWGKRAVARACGGQGQLGPESLLEALGVVEIDQTWTLSSKPGYDILTLKDDAGLPVKRIHVDWRDYLVRKIEHFNGSGKTSVVVNMSRYTDGTGKLAGIVVPTRIAIVYLNMPNGGLLTDMTLRDLKPFSPSKAQMNGKLFTLPPTKGFKNIYELDKDCKFTKQED